MSLNIKTANGRQQIASNGDVLVGGKDYEVYSENETMIGYWIDGRPIYRKVYTNISYSSGQFFSVSDNALKGTIPIRICGRARINFGGTAYRWVDMPSSQYASSDTDRFLLGSPFLNTESGQLYCYPIYLTNFSKFDNVMFIIEYIKPTDTPITNNNTYSTDEVLTGETWIDGKPIYRKVITGAVPDTSANGTNITGYIGDEILNVDAIVNIGGTVIYNGGNTVQLPWETANGGYRINIAYNITRHQISVTNGAVSYNGAPMTVILEYTKN